MDRTVTDNRTPIDVWLKFYDPATDENGEEYLAEYEANTFMTDTGYVIEWYHNDVGQVIEIEFDTLADAYDWYEANGYQDFTA